MLSEKLDPVKVQIYLNTLMTSNQTARAFKVSEMTIRAWRLSKGLPALVITGEQRPTVRFDPVMLKNWAAQNGKAFHIA